MSIRIPAPERENRTNLLITIYRGRGLTSLLFPLYLAKNLTTFYDVGMTGPLLCMDVPFMGGHDPFDPL